MSPLAIVLVGTLAMLVGALMGLLGGGGGFLYVLILITLADLSTREAIGTGVGTAAIGATVSLLGYQRHRMVDWRRLPGFLAAGTVGAASAAWLTAVLPEGVLLGLVVAVYLVVGTLPLRLFRQPEGERRPPPSRRRQYVGRAVVGAVGGITVSAFAVNGGGLISAYLTGYERADARLAVGTAVAVLSPLSIIGAVAHVAGGTIDLGYLLVLAPGASTGGYLGAYLARLVRTRILAPILGLLAVFTIIPLVLR